MRRRVFLCFFFFLFFKGFAQTDPTAVIGGDTAVALPVVEVEEKALRGRLPGERTEQWEAARLQSSGAVNLADLLGRESNVFIKSYGGGSLATTSIRGGAAGHTTVLWNGLPLQSPMLGLLDLSLLPLSFTDEVRLSYGGNSAAWGSGAVGGVIALRNRPAFGEGPSFALRSAAGSFGRYEQQVRARYGKGAWQATTRFFHSQAVNDFPYRLRPDLPERRQTHAALRQSGLLQEGYWRPAPGQELGLQVWLQQTHREIPPTTVQNRSEATQDDRFLRTALHWKAVGKRVVWQARAGLFRERIDYRDDLIGLRSLTAFWTVLAEGEGEWHLNARQRLQFGIGHTWMQAEADAYDAPPRQNRTAPFVAFRQELGSWRAQLNLRQEIVDGRLAPLVPGLGVEGELTGWLSVQAKLSRNYRLPTFNDLYWRPGGNPDLQPESGWNEEATLKAAGERGRHRWSGSLTAFNRNIDNWILWSPAEGENYWSAGNITRVWSRGLEQRLAWTLTAPDWALSLSGGYDYVVSTNEVALETPRLEAGEQLAYVPRHQAFGRLELRWKNLEAGYRHRYTGPVETLGPETLPGYQLGFLSAAYSYRRPRWNGRLFLLLDNLWDEKYRVVERRPMPGRSWQAGVEVEFFRSRE